VRALLLAMACSCGHRWIQREGVFDNVVHNTVCTNPVAPIISESLHSSPEPLFRRFSTYPFVAIPPPSSPTMTDVADDDGPFTPVSTSKASKKHCTNKPAQVFAKHEFETPIRILFKKIPKAHTDFNVPANVKQVILAMIKADHTLSILSLDKKSAYHPSHDDFPASEDHFKNFFLIHPSSALPNRRRSVTVGCLLRSSKTVKDIKFAPIEPSPGVAGNSMIFRFLHNHPEGHFMYRVTLL